MVFVGRDHNDRLVPPSLLSTVLPDAKSGFPVPHPTWPWASPVMGHPQKKKGQNLLEWMVLKFVWFFQLNLVHWWIYFLLLLEKHVFGSFIKLGSAIFFLVYALCWFSRVVIARKLAWLTPKGILILIHTDLYLLKPHLVRSNAGFHQTPFQTEAGLKCKVVSQF